MLKEIEEMSFYKTTGVTREVIAIKLARSIYRSFHRTELKYDVVLKMGVIIDRSPFQVKIWRDEREVLDSIRRERLIHSDSSPAVKDTLDATLDDIYNHRKNMEYCNTTLIKYYLLNGYDIMWWDNWGNEHGYNLEATLKSWDSTKQR